ncbi:hypothetical protein JHN56_34055 [Streptomyces sp. MBT60]|nr:hypothetical protein [Streptomyces sp. MBT60]
MLADAVRIAHWAAGTPGPGTAAPLAAHALERAATALELSPAQVRAGWDRARLAGLVELHGDTARPGWRLRAWDRDDSAVLRGWVALFDAWSLVHAAPEGIEAPAETAADQAAATAGPARSADLNALLLDWALEGLAAVGALTLGQGHATLTPLGNWAVWVKLEQICVAAQSPAGNIEQSAADMLLGCARLTPGPARDEYRAWLAARTVGSAVAELLAVARGEDALLRGLAFEALRVVGAPAEPEVRAVLAEPSLRPYALLWLAEYEGNDPDDAQDVLSREEATWLWVDTAAAVADHGETGLLVRHLDSAVQGTVPALLDEVRAVGHPRTVQVLVALAAAHPDPALAKAVRRAAFQVHTGGA